MSLNCNFTAVSSWRSVARLAMLDELLLLTQLTLKTKLVVNSGGDATAGSFDDLQIIFVDISLKCHRQSSEEIKSYTEQQQQQQQKQQPKGAADDNDNNPKDSVYAQQATMGPDIKLLMQSR